jgi:RHS repeat-associated protein
MKATEDAPPGFVARVLNKTIEVNLQPVPEITFAYDADGNLTTDGLNSYVWDAENRLVSVWNSGIGLVEFGYDAFSRRVSLSEKPDGITANKSLRLMWEGLTLVGQVDTASSVNNHTRLFFGNGERRISTIGAAVNLLYTRDHLGSIRELVDASTGAIRARYEYTPYGIRTKVQSSGDLDSDFGFTGHYTNERTGLVLAPYRAYSPELGRWISRDPIEEDGGINLYGYVEGNPMEFFDPKGLSKGGWRNLDVGDLCPSSPPDLIEKALEKAINNGGSKRHIENLRALLKVAKRIKKLRGGSDPRVLACVATATIGGLTGDALSEKYMEPPIVPEGPNWNKLAGDALFETYPGLINALNSIGSFFD